MTSPLIAPSVLAADFTRLGDDIAAIEAAADWIHVDIMDGHFVPNLSFGPDITAAIKRATDKPLDVHLMIEDPGRWVDTYIDAGANTVIFHVEALPDKEAVFEVARAIRNRRAQAGVSIKPTTPIEPWLEHLAEFDEVLVMSVEPGFGGQEFMPEMVEKVRALRKQIDSTEGLNTTIEIDGGISTATIGQAAEAGCDAFVAGSAVFKHADPAAAVNGLRQAAREGRSTHVAESDR